MPSRKITAAAITGLAMYLLTKLAVQADPAVEQAVNVAAMVLAGYLVREPDPSPDPKTAPHQELED